MSRVTSALSASLIEGASRAFNLAKTGDCRSAGQAEVTYPRELGEAPVGSLGVSRFDIAQYSLRAPRTTAVGMGA